MLRCWIFFEQYSHEPHIAVNRYWKLHLPAAEQSRLADRFAQNHTRGEHALSVMEERLSESPWLAAGRYTIADIALCAHTHMAANGGFDLAPHPNGQSKTAEATVVKQQFDSVWARVAVAAREEPKVCRLSAGGSRIRTITPSRTTSPARSWTVSARRTQICAATSFLAPSCSSFPFSKSPIPACARSKTSARVLQGCGFGYAHMLGTNADPNQPGRNATQNRKNLEELEE